MATNATFNDNKTALNALTKAHSNVVMFINNDDLLNLIALTNALSALISVDTGNVHIADNLCVPTIGLYKRSMFKRWRGGSYGGAFEGFVLDGSNNADKAFLAFIKAHLPNMLKG